MNKIIDNIKSGNYEVVDNQGVSVTGHFTQCLEKEFADLEAKLEEKDKEIKQDKISFTIEQLEQLKKLCQEKFNWWENSEWEGDIYDKSDVSNAYFDIEANIEEQINEIKERCKND